MAKSQVDIAHHSTTPCSALARTLSPPHRAATNEQILFDGDGRTLSHFREVAPFVWREIGGKNWLAAKVPNGKVEMWSDDQDSNGTVFLPRAYQVWKMGVAPDERIGGGPTGP